MDRKLDSELTKDMVILLNAGRGPPDELSMTSRPSTTGINDLRPPRITPTTNTINPDLISSSVDPSNQSARDEIIRKLQTDLRQKGDGLNVLVQMLREKTRANNELKKQLNDLTKQLSSKLNEESEDAKRFKRLATASTMLPDVSTNDGGKLLGVDAREPGEPGCGLKNWDFNEDFSTSIPCSEDLRARDDDLPGGSSKVHEVIPKVNNATVIPGTSFPARDWKSAEAARETSSSSSSSSFEIVARENCVGTTTEKQDNQSERSGHVVWTESLTAEKASKHSAKIVEFQGLRLEVESLKRAIEAERRERINEHLQLKAQMMRLTNVTTQQNSNEISNSEMRRKLEEMEHANWKLEQQKLELVRENESLKYHREGRQEELPSEGSEMLQSELQKLRDELERLLVEKSQKAAEATSRIRELERDLVEKESALALNNSTAYESLANENAVLKCQIDTYKDDFKVERKDREKVVSQKDTLQRSFDTIRCELNVARQQLKKYEDDISLLRTDNDRLKTRLRQVNDELISSSKKTDFISQTNDLSSQVYARPNVEWNCKTCTYSNPTSRSSCEMCGTYASSSATAPPPPPPHHPMQRNIAETTPRHPPSNGLNYGDLDID